MGARTGAGVPGDPAPQYLTVDEVARLAGCEHKAVRRAIHLGHLVAFQPANKLLVPEHDAHAWIQSRPAPVAAPVPREPPRPRRAAPPSAGSVANLRELERQLSLDDIKSV